MVNFARLVNQQIAYAEYHLGAPHGALYTPDPFARRCQQRAVELQLSLALSAYCGEVVERAGYTAYPLPTRVGPTLFSDAQTLLLERNKHSSELEELVYLSAPTQWLGLLLNTLELTLNQDNKASLSPMLSRTTLTEANEEPGLIATNRTLAESPAAIDWLATISTFKALVQRQRDDKAEY